MTDSDATAGDLRDGTAGTVAPPLKDRKAGLIVFGILLLLMALASLGSAGLQVLMLVGGDSLAAQSAASGSLYGFAAVFYVLVAATAAWLGVGAIRCRRWARAFILALSGLFLATGVVTAIYGITAFGTFAEMLRAQAGDDEVAALVPLILGCVVVVIGFFYLALPAAFFIFFRSPHVKATCEHYDPTPRWTDRYPVPLLAGVLLLLFSALVLLAPILDAPMPLFGALLTGAPAWIYAAVTGLLALVLAAGLLRFDRRAWIGSLAFLAAAGGSAYLSFRGDGLLKLYEGMGYTEEQVEVIRSFNLAPGVSTLILLTLVVMLAYFAWLGRYFTGRPGGGPGSVAAPQRRPQPDRRDGGGIETP